MSRLQDILSAPRGLWRMNLIAVIGLGIFLNSGCVMAQPNIVLTSNKIAGIEIHGSPEIPGELSRAFDVASVKGLLPYAVLVSNTGATSINGLDIRYLISAKGHTVVKNFFYGSTDLADAASTPVIAPGKSIVICPDHLINEQIMSGGSISIPSRHVDEVNHKLDMYFRNADTVLISVDSVIRTGGVLSGPDRADRSDLFQRQVDAYTQFRNDLLAQFARGAPNDQIIAWLMTVSQQKVGRLVPSNVADHGAVLQRVLAVRYLALMRSGQRQQAWDTLTNSPPEVELHQIIGVRKDEEER